jgi:hypothetical protein
MLAKLMNPTRPVPVPAEERVADPVARASVQGADGSWLPAAVAAFVVLGCFLRIFRFAQNLPLWSDECFLAVSFLKRGYLDLLQPLDNGQIAPLLYLWAERFVLDLLGFSEWSLRLLPLLCGLCSLYLFWKLSTQALNLNGLAVMLAVGIFAVSVHPIRHAAEAKPYASDLLVSLMLLVPAVTWLRNRDSIGWLWALAGLAPAAILLSNPAVFVAGGIGLGLLVPAWRSGRWSARLGACSFGLATAAAFALAFLSYGHAQGASAIDGLQDYWAGSFPPLRDPARFLGWLIAVHTGSAFAYPGGGARGASTATFLAFLAGVVVMVRRRDRSIVACLISPSGLAFLAAALHRYPYGTEARLMQFMAPSICILAGLGAAAAVERIRRPRPRRAVLATGLAGLVVCGVVPQVVSSMHPYRMIYDHQQREFARRFWPSEAARGPLACAHIDFGLDPAGGWQGRKAWYLCNQMIYSPQRRKGRVVEGQQPAGDSPLRCVVFEERMDSPRLRAWLDAMQESYELVDVQTHDLPVTMSEGIPMVERWRVFEFVPRASEGRRVMAGGEPTHRRSL